MEKDIDIAEILKDKPIYITKLWSPLYGDVFLSRVLPHDGIRVVCQTGGDEKPFFCNGKFTIAGEVCLFPSRNMRDWSKYAWKKGDVLKCTDGNMSYFAIFEAFEDEEYATFKSRYNYVCDNNWLQFNRQSSTNLFIKVSDVDSKLFIKEIENYYGGKLNLETLNIENPKPQFKDGDIVQIDYDIFVILKRIEPYNIYYHYYYKNGIVNFNGSIGRVGQSLKLASKADQLTILSHLKEYEKKQWDADKKQIVDLPKKCEFKAFDKVLVRDTKDECWRPAFFASFDKNCISEYAYGLVGDPEGVFCKYCIPYNDQTAHLLGTTDDWKGGER